MEAAKDDPAPDSGEPADGDPSEGGFKSKFSTSFNQINKMGKQFIKDFRWSKFWNQLVQLGLKEYLSHVLYKGYILLASACI